jgi:hypothetical protein
MGFRPVRPDNLPCLERLKLSDYPRTDEERDQQCRNHGIDSSEGQVFENIEESYISGKGV